MVIIEIFVRKANTPQAKYGQEANLLANFPKRKAGGEMFLTYHFFHQNDTLQFYELMNRAQNTFTAP